MVQVSKHYLKNCRWSYGDRNSTIKCDRQTPRQMDKHTDGYMDVLMAEGTPIRPPPLLGGGLKNFRSYCACAMYHLGLCSPFKHSIVSNYSVADTQDPDQTVRTCRLIWAFFVLMFEDTRFCMVGSYNVGNKLINKYTTTSL